MHRAPLLLALLLACRPAQEAPRACVECQSGSATAAYPAIVLRTYQVPAGQDKLVERLLDGTTSYPVSVVSAQGVQTQFVHPTPHFTGNGYFVLGAPETIQQGVRQLLDELARHPGAPAQSSVDTTYWLVLGWPAKDTAISERLADVAPALKTMSNFGAMRFELLERIELVALDGEQAHAGGQTAHVKQTASRDRNAMELRVEVSASGDTPATLETTVTVKPGQFAVFGQSGFVPRGAMQTDPKPTLFYVVRAQPAS